MSNTALHEDKKRIKLFLKNVKWIKSVLHKLGTIDDNPLLRTTLEEKREETKELDKAITKKLENRKQYNDDEYTMLVNKFHKYKEYWNTTLYKETFLRERMTQDANKIALEEQPKPVQFVGQKQQYMSKDEITNALLQERNKGIKEVKEEVVAVAELYQKTAELLANQHQHLDIMEQNILQAEAQSEEAVLTLAHAAKQQAHASTLSGVAIGGTVGGLVGCVLGPVGALLGASTGATLGGVVGNNIEHFKKVVVDKELFERHMKNKWLPDEYASACMKCGSVFSQINRKHHCRSCGKIFCSQCTSKRIAFKFPEMDTERVERVCETCYRDHWSK